MCSAGLFIQESPPGYSYSDYIQDLEAEDRFQDLVENESLQFEDAYNKTQMKALVIFAEQQAKDENLFKVSLSTLMYASNCTVWIPFDEMK